MAKIALTGIKPTGTPHIGNYLGMIKPALELTRSFQAFYFISDYHALTTKQDRSELNNRIYEVAATGSVGMGRHVSQAVASRLGKTILELGGNNAVIVTPRIWRSEGLCLAPLELPGNVAQPFEG